MNIRIVQWNFYAQWYFYEKLWCARNAHNACIINNHCMCCPRNVCCAHIVHIMNALYTQCVIRAFVSNDCTYSYCTQSLCALRTSTRNYWSQSLLTNAQIAHCVHNVRNACVLRVQHSFNKNFIAHKSSTAQCTHSYTRKKNPHTLLHSP